MRSTGNRVIDNRIRYFLLFLATMGLGLFSRSGLFHKSSFIVLYVGDSLWALAVYWTVCMISPQWKIQYQAIASLTVSYTIELSQLYQAPWINGMRTTAIGALVLGFGFRMSDLIAYAIGISSGALLSYGVFRKQCTAEAHSQ